MPKHLPADSPAARGYQAAKQQRLRDIKKDIHPIAGLPLDRVDPDYIAAYKAEYYRVAKTKNKVQAGIRLDPDLLELARKQGLNVSKVCGDALTKEAEKNISRSIDN